jgi:hypothetical protein
MITDLDVTYNFNRDKLKGAPLVFVIDGECLYDYVFTEEGVDLLTKNKGIRNVSSEHPSHDGSTLEIIKENDEVELYQTNEYFGSILLSEPLIVNSTQYPYGHHVVSPDASFDGEKFIIKNRTVYQHSLLTEWAIYNPNHPDYVDALYNPNNPDYVAP